MLFQYSAIDEQGNHQTGKIEAESIQEATAKLNDMALSVLNVEAIDENEIDTKGSKLKTFNFLGKDQEAKEIGGTIEAEHELIAYKRLVEEYGMDVSWITDASLPKEVQDAKKKTSIDKLNELAYERGIDIKKKIKSASGKETLETAIMGEDFQIRQKQLQEKLDSMILLTQKTFIPIIEPKDPGQSVEIEQKLEHLQKVKRSNNLQLLEEESDDLIEMVLDFFDKNPNSTKSISAEILELKTLSSRSTQASLEKQIIRISKVAVKRLCFAF